MNTLIQTNSRCRWSWKYLFPILSCGFAIILDIVLPDSSALINVQASYTVFLYLLCASALIFCICAAVSYRNQGYRLRYLPKTNFYAVMILALNIANIITKKTALLPAIYFPTFDSILSVFVTDAQILLTCTLYSMRLLVLGILIGGTLGFLTGILIGWNQKAYYWLFPCIRFIGPIPATIWIPISMLFFPTLVQAAVFIIALSMWFPVTFLTSSGIQNVSKTYYEAAVTLGAKTRYQILHIAVPAAMPQIFVGIFYGMVSSLISLMSAELIGARYGVGWFINWQQQVMHYPKVYAGFLIIAMICFLIFKLIFNVRNRVLSWQKGAIRW